jgi:hypothetical protein
MKKVIVLLLCFLMVFPMAIVIADEETPTDVVVSDDETIVLDEDDVITGDAAPEEAPGEEPPRSVDELRLTVHWNGTSDLSYIGAIDAQYHDQLKQQYEPMGYVIESAKLGENQDVDALKLTKTTEKGVPFNISMPGNAVEGYEALRVNRGLYTTYVLNVSYDMRQYPTDEELLKVEVKLPVAPTYANATSHKGLRYTWSFRGQANNSVQFIVLVPNLLAILILLIVIAAIVFGILFFLNDKKKKALLAATGFDGESETDEYADAFDADLLDGEEALDAEETIEELTEDSAEETEEDVIGEITEDVADDVTDETPAQDEE